jgi:putative FmdB family regulatory protein
MPTYQYQCLSCGELFDHFQKMSDTPISHCICCKKGKVKRLIGSGAGIIFKGSGFYETDYKKSKNAPKTETEKSPVAPSKNIETKTSSSTTTKQEKPT